MTENVAAPTAPVPDVVPSAAGLDRQDLLLGAFDRLHPSLTLGGLTARTGLPRTTVYRHATAMVRVGWLEHRDGRYRPGPRLYELAGLSELTTVLRTPAAPVLHRLAATTGETVHLAVLDGADIVYVEKIEGRRPATRLTRVGGRQPAHCTALGKVLAAHAGEDARTLLLECRLEPRTTRTLVKPQRLHNELRQVLNNGYATDREESAVGLTCVATPVFAPEGRCLAAVSISTRVDRMRTSETIPALRRATAELTTLSKRRPSLP